MKTELKAKFLQHILKNMKSEKGFTLIELLVVIIIIGILSAIALPSFLNQAAKAKQSEAKNYVGSVNRAQQAYRLENIEFAPDFKILKVGIPTETENYIYTVAVTAGTQADIEAASQDEGSLRSYAGQVVVNDDGTTSAATCQTTGPDATPPAVDATGATPAEQCAGSEPMK